MVHAGHLVPDEVGDIAAVLLGIHADDIIPAAHPLPEAVLGDHLDAEGVQEFGGAEFVDPAVVAEGSGDAVAGQELLEAVGGGDGVGVGEVMGLEEGGMATEELGQGEEVGHGAGILSGWCLGIF